MVFLIDHDTDRLIEGQAATPSSLAEGMLTTDEMTFNQELPVEHGHGLHTEIAHAFGYAGIEEPLTNHPLQLSQLLFIRRREERIAGKITGEPDPGADHDISFRPRAAEPFARAGLKITEFHVPGATLFQLISLLSKLSRETELPRELTTPGSLPGDAGSHREAQRPVRNPPR